MLMSVRCAKHPKYHAHKWPRERKDTGKPCPTCLELYYMARGIEVKSISGIRFKRAPEGRVV